MKEMSCFCTTFSSLLEQMVKAYKYMTGIFSVTHTSEQQASDRDKQPTKMDVSLLEEQYDHIKQKQKLQSHIIVFKTGEHESVLPESMVNAVLINKKVRRSKSFTECVPVRKVSLEMTSDGSIQDNSPWRTHLGIHRLAQAPCQGVRWDHSHCKNRPFSFDNQRLIPKENGTLQPKELEGESELFAPSQLGSSSTLKGFSKENGSNIASTCPKPLLKSATSAVWTHQLTTSTKCRPACNKLNFYPFPNKKGPRISEAARRLGLYVSQ
uniref:Chromosome 9 open reading frame 152 n=1 Tax=Calidris pygmaea TaxID=425635 RepID=A0A8C3KP13_9CHAR